jgi:hypothetical protein
MRKITSFKVLGCDDKMTDLGESLGKKVASWYSDQNVTTPGPIL